MNLVEWKTSIAPLADRGKAWLVEKTWAAASATNTSASADEDSVHWVVNDLGELGVEIGGRCFFLYKGYSLEYKSGLHDDGTPMLYRMVGKREFGETQWPQSWIIAGKRQDRYTQELEYVQGLSDGKPGDADWKPLPVISNG